MGNGLKLALLGGSMVLALFLTPDERPDNNNTSGDEPKPKTKRKAKANETPTSEPKSAPDGGHRRSGSGVARAENPPSAEPDPGEVIPEAVNQKDNDHAEPHDPIDPENGPDRRGGGGAGAAD